MHKRLVALPGRQAAEHRRGGGREVVSISRVEGRTGDAARVPGVATSRKVRAREPQPRTLQRGLAPPPAAVDGGVDGHRAARAEVAPASRQCRSAAEWTVSWSSECRSREHSPKAPTQSPRTAGYCSRRWRMGRASGSRTPAWWRASRARASGARSSTASGETRQARYAEAGGHRRIGRRSCLSSR